MSRRLAAGWSRSRFQSVSVVPMIQWLLPRDHEEDARCPCAGSVPAVAVNAIARHHEVDALGGANAGCDRGPPCAARRIRPDARGVDDALAAARPDRRPGLEAAHLGAGDAVRRLVQRSPSLPGHWSPSGGAELRGGARERRGVAGVVDLRVVVLDRSGERVACRRPGSVFAALPRGLKWRCRGSCALDRQQCRRAGRPLRCRCAPRTVGQREEEGNGLHEVRAQTGSSIRSARVCASRTSPKSSLLEVAEAAVDQLAGAARGAGRPVALLDQSDRQAASCCVERSTTTRHAAAYDDDVEALFAQPAQGTGAVLGPEGGGIHHDSRFLLSRRRSPGARVSRKLR